MNLNNLRIINGIATVDREDAWRYKHSGVLILEDKTVVTDGHVLIVVASKEKNENLGQLPAKAVREFIAMLPAATIDGLTARSQSGLSVTLPAAESANEYPRWDHAVNTATSKTPVLQFSINIEILWRLLGTLVSIIPQNYTCVNLSFTDNESPIVITGITGENQQFTALVMPMRFDALKDRESKETARLYFDTPDKYRDALETIANAEVTSIEELKRVAREALESK